MNETVPMCNPLCFTKNCTESTACISWECDYISGDCVNKTTVCNDNNLCTVDSCDDVTGCTYTTIDCDGISTFPRKFLYELI